MRERPHKTNYESTRHNSFSLYLHSISVLIRLKLETKGAPGPPKVVKRPVVNCDSYRYDISIGQLSISNSAAKLFNVTSS